MGLDRYPDEERESDTRDLRWGSKKSFRVLDGQMSILDELEDPEEDRQISLKL